MGIAQALVIEGHSRTTVSAFSLKISYTLSLESYAGK